MATLNDRIKRINSYFKGFNIGNDTSFVLVNFPITWKIFDEKYLNVTYKVYTSKKSEGIYFISGVENGVDCLFDAIDYTISQNKTVEEKQELLQKKATELTQLFINEPIEKLKTLTFVFSKQRKVKTKNTNVVKEIKNVEEVVNDTVNDDCATIVEDEVVKEETIEATKKENDKKEKKEVKQKKKIKEKNSENMEFFKSLTGE